ncbi:uncharacterized protein LOC124161583 [Ischnura elegans]|uniref:uncharacterized protein LOC124161583 n=1 Tax=Ischnura elegans TaxID=197161 RepID=UPI001ED894E3|nr:uncharacterized protein LOC124161583 [Ischnura elegans]
MSRYLAFLALMAVVVVVAASPKQDYMVRPFPGNCAFFYSCASFNCPNGMVFDPSSSRCSPRGFRHPLTRGDTALFPDDSDSSRYWECTKMPCPSGLEFNPVTLKCDDPITAGCTP